MIRRSKVILLTIIIAIIVIVVPIILNWALQWKAIVPVIGDSATWLSFWGTYVGAVLTAVMVLATFITIRKTSKMNKMQWRREWLHSFHSAAVDLISAMDSTAVGQMAQDVNFWRFDQAVDKGHAMEVAVKRSAFLLSSAMKEYDEVFYACEGGKYIDELNSFIAPFLQGTGEIIQFAIICKFLKEKTDSGQRQEGVKAIYEMSDSMATKQYLVIQEALRCINDGDYIVDVVHNAVVKMQQNLAAVDIEGLEKLLLKIGTQNARLTYDDSIIDSSMKGRVWG